MLKALTQRDAITRFVLALALSGAMAVAALIALAFYDGRHEGLISLFFVGREGYDDEIVTIAVALICAAALMPFLAVASILSRMFLLRRSRQSLAQLSRHARRDPLYDHTAIQKRTREIYADIQRALAERNTAPLQRSLSDRLRPAFAALVRRLTANGWRYAGKTASLDLVQVVDVMSGASGIPQRLVVLVAGAHDHRAADAATGEPVRDFRVFPPHFAELWRMVRGPEGWLLDETGDKASPFVAAAFADQGGA